MNARRLIKSPKKAYLLGVLLGFWVGMLMMMELLLLQTLQISNEPNNTITIEIKPVQQIPDGDYKIDEFLFRLRENFDNPLYNDYGGYTFRTGTIWIKTKYGDKPATLDQIYIVCNHEVFHNIANTYGNITLSEELARNVENTLNHPSCKKLIEVLKNESIK